MGNGNKGIRHGAYGRGGASKGYRDMLRDADPRDETPAPPPNPNPESGTTPYQTSSRKNYGLAGPQRKKKRFMA